MAEISFSIVGQDRFSSNVKRALTQTRSLTGSIFNLKNAMIGLAGGAVAKTFVDTVSKFQMLEASLVTVTGSQEKASQAFDRMQQIASTMPVTLDKLVGGFVKLQARGLTPSEAAIKSYGDTASAMGKSLDQMIEAVADASTGEFERLKEFGIKANAEGDKIRFTFRGVETVVKRDAASIEKHLIQLGQVNFAGAMEDQMKTLGGALSNAKDAVDAFFKAIGDQGSENILTEFINDSAQALRDFTQLIKSGAIADELSVQQEMWSETIDAFKGKIDELVSFLSVESSGSISEFFRNFPIEAKAAFGIAFGQVDKFLSKLSFNFDHASIIAQTAFGNMAFVVQRAFLNVQSFIAPVMNAIREGMAMLIESLAKAASFIPAMGEMAEKMNLFADSIRSTVTTQGEFTGKLQQSKDAQLELNREMRTAIEDRKKQLQDELDLIQRTIMGVIAKRDAQVQSVEAQRASLENLREQAQEAQKTLDEIIGSNAVGERIRTTFEIFKEETARFLEESSLTMESFALKMVEVVGSTIDAISAAVATAIVDGKSLMDSFKEIGKSILKTMIQFFVKMGIQRLLTSTIFAKANANEASQSMARASADTWAGAYAATVQIPVIGPVIAPGVAATAQQTMLAGAIGAASQGAAVGAGIGGIAHGGLESVPRETTFLLDKGERVLSPRQNQSLTKFLANQSSDNSGASSGVTIENLNVEVLPNATSADAFLRMDSRELREAVAIPIMNAFEELIEQGFVPSFISRGGS